MKILARPKAPLLLSQVAPGILGPKSGGNYPLDTKEQVQEAWSKVNKAKVASNFTADGLRILKGQIAEACNIFDIDISDSQKQGWGYTPELPLVQDHYHIESSMEELLSKISYAFSAWHKAPPYSEDYCHSSILGVKEDQIIFYTERGSWQTRPELHYYSVGYSTGGDTGEITINSDSCKSIDVKLVVEELGMGESEKEQGMEDKKTEETQATSTKVEFSDKNPKPVAAESEAANTTGASVSDSEINGDGTNEENISPTDAELDNTAPKFPQSRVVQDESKMLQGVGYDSGGQPMSYIQSTKITEVDGKKQMVIQAIVTKGDIINKKGEVYPLTIWDKNLPKMNQAAKAGKFLGKLEHPLEEQGLVDTAIKFDKFWIQGAEVWAEATVVPTEPHGKNLQALIEAGVQVDFSSRGYGSKILQDWRGTERPVIQDDFVCTAFDAVWHGASTGSGLKSVEYQSEDKNPAGGNVKNVEKTVVETQGTPTAQQRAASLVAKTQLDQTRTALLTDSGLSDLGQNAYRQALDSCENVEALIEKSDTFLPVLQSTFSKEGPREITQSDTYMPQFFIKQTAEELAPQNVGEMFDRMVADLPDHYEGQSSAANPSIPNHFRSPREAVKRTMVNIAREQQGAFSGRNAALALLALEQGKIDRAQDILTQSLPTGGTTAASNADNGGAPLSNYLIFPLVRRVYPQYIMNEICSIQPMDRPDGKIFFLDHYRIPAGGTPEARIDLNTSSNPFSSSFADNAEEGAAARMIRLRLKSESITAHTKKLGAAWSVEEMQDLRAYHGLDAAQELLGGVAREMALEWNKEVLDDMLAQATGAALTWGGTAPATGFSNQKDWDEYLWVYIQQLDNLIFSKRNGPMTHLVVGIDAAIALSKSMRGTFTIGGNAASPHEMEMFPGTTFYGSVATPNGSSYRVFKTNFWGTGTPNGSKIMGLRKGSEWSDTPYIWAPYTDYVTPMLTDPADFTQKQGIISRAAKKVVVSDAIGYITVGSTTGVGL